MGTHTERTKSVMKIWVAGTLLSGIFGAAGVGVDRAWSLAPQSPKSTRKARLLHSRELLGAGIYSRSPVVETESLSERQLTRRVVSLFRKKFSAQDQHSVLHAARALITESRSLGLDPILGLAVIETESQFDPRRVGSVGEIGLMQLRPSTAQWIAQERGIEWKGAASLFQPVTNIRLGLAYLAKLRESFHSEGRLYLSAYNMGGSAVRRLVAREQRPKAYAQKVLGRYLSLYSELISQSGEWAFAAR